MKMKSLTFYHQKRLDGGIRTGVELDGERILECFEPGSPLEDPKLLWWIDVRCSQKTWPSEPEEVRAWLLENAQRIEGGLSVFAAELGAGIDINWPAKHVVSSRTGLKIEIFCSAMRRVGGREIQAELSNLAKNWQTIIAQLPSNEAAIAD
jgi:hypothetical protein